MHPFSQTNRLTSKTVLSKTPEDYVSIDTLNDFIFNLSGTTISAPNNGGAILYQVQWYQSKDVILT